MRICFLTIALCFSALSNATALENVTSDCSWKPARARQLKEMTDLKVAQVAIDWDEFQKRTNNLYLKVDGRRIYFYSLPNESCRSKLFVVKGDVVEQIDMLGDLSWLRVAYRSKRLNTTIIGWVKNEDLCRNLGRSDGVNLRFEC